MYNKIIEKLEKENVENGNKKKPFETTKVPENTTIEKKIKKRLLETTKKSKRIQLSRIRVRKNSSIYSTE